MALLEYQTKHQCVGGGHDRGVHTVHVHLFKLLG